MRTTSVSQQGGDNNDTEKVKKSIVIRSFLVKYIYRPEYIWYSIGVIVRILWTLIFSQKGYIHPDEFFQGPEIVFDDIFRTNLTRTHEFNSKAPLRSVAILYLLYGLPVSILSWLSSIFHWSSIPFHLKLVFPRSTILLLSLCTDILFYRMIKLSYPNLNSKQYGIIMNYYGIAHVTLVFFTRTLSNSFEAFLFLALIYFVNINISLLLSIIIDSSNELRSHNDSNQNIVQSKYQSIHINFHIILTSSLIGLICALGIFNRPTFPAFAIVPIIYWFTNIVPLLNHSFHYQLLLSRIIGFIIGTFIITSCLLIFFDSYYYNNGFSFIMDLKNHLIICPLNFILYNTDSNNLDQHGLHPCWLHFIVNAIILYGPLHLCIVLWSLFHILNIKQYGQSMIDRILKVFHKKSITTRQSEQSTSQFLLCLYLVPFFPLSTFPHQEPRFLLPLIFPLILFIVPLLIIQNLHTYMFRVWFAFNIFITIIYGHLHQGGLLPALQYIHDCPILSSNGISIVNDMNKKFLITYHTYMPPGYLVTSMSKSEYEQKLQTIIIDLKGGKHEELDLTIEHLFNEYPMSNIQIFVLLPNITQTHLTNLKQQKYSFQLLKQFEPHLDLDHGFDELFHIKYEWIHTIRNKYKLDLYQITQKF
ncbi:unnamed protein product [Rotaria sordida]|uniref:Mannosyltransferase n=1 Tax=Rotaria sordida TaxID=392033 RepID=A0A813T1A5_9BILA|nr:unnamed protein product [Rotaria sordida]